MITYRFATPEDTDAILAIYSQYIHTSITFEYRLPSQEEFRARIEEIGSFYPYLAAVEHGRIIGYAYAHRAFERTAYQWDVEFSVYIDRASTRRGIGRALYQKLIDLSRLQRIHIAYAKVTSPNEPSEALHQSLGFEKLAVFENVGYKNGAWHSITWFGLTLCEFEDQPEPPIAIGELSAAEIQTILSK